MSGERSLTDHLQPSELHSHTTSALKHGCFSKACGHDLLGLTAACQAGQLLTRENKAWATVQTPATWGARRAHQDADSTPGPPSRPLGNPVWRSLRLLEGRITSRRARPHAPQDWCTAFRSGGGIRLSQTPLSNLNVTEARCSPIISNQHKSTS